MTSSNPATAPMASRRGMLGLSSLALGLPAALTSLTAPIPARAQTPGKPLDLNDKDDYLTALQKMRGALDNRICMGGVLGYYYGVVDHRLVPMYGVLAGTFSRYRLGDDGNYHGSTFEVAYFTDWDTGELLEKYKNPLTGEIVDVPQTRMGPSPIVISREGRMIPKNPAGEAAGLDISHRFLPARVVNNDVWIVEEISAGTPKGFKGPTFVYNEVTNYHATLDQINDPNLKQTPTLVHFNGIVSWRPWLKMGDQPGHLLGNATGRRYASMDEYPAKYQELTKKHHPDVWADPGKILDQIEG